MSIPQTCFVGYPDLLGLIQNDRNKAEAQRNHQSHPALRNKRNGSEKPDESTLELSWPGHRCKKDGVAENESQSPACDSPQSQSFPAHRNPRDSGQTGARREKRMNKEEGKKEDRPSPGVPKELP